MDVPQRDVLFRAFAISASFSLSRLFREGQGILVMKDGDIIESGNHETLMARDGFYADLYNSQFEQAS